jgi:hypothetical protein
MERNQKLQRKGDARPERGEVKLDHRYGRIGISAVTAAVQCHGERHEERTEEAGNTTSKRESKSEKKFNLGQREAAQEKQKDTELRHMGELSKRAEQEQTGKKR